MKKVLGRLFWGAAIAGVIVINLTVWLIENYVIFYIGLFLLIVGIIGVVLTCKKTRKYILNLLDFL